MDVHVAVIGAFDLQVLRELAAPEQRTRLSPKDFVAALGYLRTRRFIDKQGNITAEGTACLRANEGT
jgi:hypothetical protein